MGDNLEKEYLEDKRYIYATLTHTKEHTEKLHEKLEVFKLDVTQALAVIQTKQLMYSGVGSFFMSTIVGVAVYYLTRGQ